MLSFKSFIVENVRVTTREHLLELVASHKKSGEIINPAYVDLKSQSVRIFGKEREEVNKGILHVMHSSDRNHRNPHLDEIYYALPHDLRGLNKLEKILQKASKANEPALKEVIKSCTTLIQNWKGIADDINSLKDKVVKVTQKREEAKVAKAKDMTAKFNDSSSLIKILESHLNEYKDMARDRAQEFIDSKLKTLKDGDWDLNKVAPAPRATSVSRTAYQEMLQKRSVFLHITSAKNASTRVGDPTDIRTVNHAGVERYVKNAVTSAEASYKEFMQKMITKIGKPVVEASMTGSIWTGAVLTVKTDDGESQTWKTKMILNFSKYQTMFNQFPTTRAK